MQGLSWLLAAAALCACGLEVDGQCRDITDCTDLDSQEKIMQQTTAEEVEKESLSLGALLSSLVQDNDLQGKRSYTGPFRTDDRRSYSMEHFRWGKPMGRKRRPVKVYTATSDEEISEDQSVETQLAPQTRRQLDSREDRGPGQKKNANNTEKYRMKHFRWDAPPAPKRYGGFMKPWSEKSSKPFITLLRNIIIKDGQ